MVFHHDKCKAPKIFCFPSVRICYKQTYSAFYQSVHLQIPLSAYKESWKIHSTTPSVFSVFVYACVCVCLCLCARALYYVLLLFWYNSLIEGSLEPWMVGAIHAKDKYVNNCIVRYFEIFEVTKVLERLLNSLFDWWKGNTVCRKYSYITVLLFVQSGGKYHRLQIPNDGHYDAKLTWNVQVNDKW